MVIVSIDNDARLAYYAPGLINTTLKKYKPISNYDEDIDMSIHMTNSTF